MAEPIRQGPPAKKAKKDTQAGAGANGSVKQAAAVAPAAGATARGMAGATPRKGGSRLAAMR